MLNLSKFELHFQANTIFSLA